MPMKWLKGFSSNAPEIFAFRRKPSMKRSKL